MSERIYNTSQEVGADFEITIAELESEGFIVRVGEWPDAKGELKPAYSIAPTVLTLIEPLLMANPTWSPLDALMYLKRTGQRPARVDSPTRSA
jgi:hypothetical protein